MSSGAEQTHNVGCVVFATKVLGDKWTPRLLFALSQKTLRFCELQQQAGGVNPRTLTQRLIDLEQLGIIHKQTFNESPPRVDYSLTPKGQDLVPILRKMAEWGDKYGAKDTKLT